MRGKSLIDFSAVFKKYIKTPGSEYPNDRYHVMSLVGKGLSGQTLLADFFNKKPSVMVPFLFFTTDIKNDSCPNKVPMLWK